jgi:hypothetical protein
MQIRYIIIQLLNICVLITVKEEVNGLTTEKSIKLGGLILGVVFLNIIVLSHGFVGVEIGGSALESAIGVTLLFISFVVVIYGSYVLLFKQPTIIPVKSIKTHDDYILALNSYKHIKVLEEDIALALSQLEQITKKRSTLISVLNQRFEPTELSFKKFISVIQEVENLFYRNIRSILSRLGVFDVAEFSKLTSQKVSRLPHDLFNEKMSIYNEYLTFVKSSLGTNEEILLKLDKLLLEISRLDSLELSDVESMPCMQEIDSLIKQTKLYKQ